MKNVIFVLCVFFLLAGCSFPEPAPPQSDSGIKKASVKVTTNASGLTNEQENVGDRLREDSKIGVIKHLYVISPYSGQVIIYSTVKAKVTSSSKRLTPTTLRANGEPYSSDTAYKIRLNGNSYYTQEVLQDDGTYGSSVPYIFWWDVQGRYHQHFFTGGQIIHISDHPIPVKNITINMELIK